MIRPFAWALVITYWSVSHLSDGAWNASMCPTRLTACGCTNRESAVWPRHSCEVGNAAGIPHFDGSSPWTAGTHSAPPGQEANMSLDLAKVVLRCSPSKGGRPHPVLSLLGATSADAPENGANRRSL